MHYDFKVSPSLAELANDRRHSEEI